MSIDAGFDAIATPPSIPPITTGQVPVPIISDPPPAAPTAPAKPAKPSTKKAAPPAKAAAPKKAAPKKTAAKKTVQTTVSCDSDLMDRIKARAEQEERTLSVVIGRLLREAMQGWSPGDEG